MFLLYSTTTLKKYIGTNLYTNLYRPNGKGTVMKNHKHTTVNIIRCLFLEFKILKSLVNVIKKKTRNNQY